MSASFHKVSQASQTDIDASPTVSTADANSGLTTDTYYE